MKRNRELPWSAFLTSVSIFRYHLERETRCVPILSPLIPVLDEPLPNSARCETRQGYQAIRDCNQVDEEVGSCLCPYTDQILSQDVGVERRVYQLYDPPLVSLSVASGAESSLALFLGTGNATPDLPSVMMERLYTSPTYGMWYPIDNKSLSSNLPPMVVFPESTKFYRKWQQDLENRGVTVSLNRSLKHPLTQGSSQHRANGDCVSKSNCQDDPPTSSTSGRYAQSKFWRPRPAFISGRV